MKTAQLHSESLCLFGLEEGGFLTLPYGVREVNCHKKKEVDKLLKTTDLLDLWYTKEHSLDATTCTGSGKRFSSSEAFQTLRHFQIELR